MHCKALRLLVALALLASPASAAWDRVEYFGGYAGNGYWGVDLLSAGIYHDRYGVGVGTKLADLRLQTWDLPRKGRPDASSHGMVIPFPLEARVVLASWEGKPYQDYLSFESSNGRVELKGWYCPWTIFSDLTDVQPGVIGATERDPVYGVAYGTTWDAALSFDAGKLWAVEAGRFEFKTREDGVFRSRQDGRWYAQGRFYLGRTHGRTIQSTPLNILHDVGKKLCRLFGGCGTIEG